MKRRKLLAALLGAPIAAGLVLAASQAEALPFVPLNEALEPDVQPAQLLGRSLHRMRRQAARRRAQRRRVVRRRR